MAGGGDGITVSPQLPRISSWMARPLAGGVNESQVGPAGVGTNLQAGSAAGTPVRPGGTASTTTTPPAAEPQANLREQEHFMPITNVIRIMRRILPMHAKISDDAKMTILECVSEYIGFITIEANERCQWEQRKTITADDVIWAMGKLGFDDYVGPLRRYLQRYRESEGDQRIGLRNEPFSIVKHRRHPQITASRSICSQPPPICPLMLPPPPQSSLIMPRTAPPPCTNHLSGEGSGSGYFLGMYGGGDGEETSNYSEAPPMPDFFA